MTNFVDVFGQLQNVAQIARKCPTPVLRRAYVTAMRDWCFQTQWLRVTIPGATVANTPQYNLGSDPLIEIVAVFAMSGQLNNGTPPSQWPMGPSDPTTWNPAIGPTQPQVYAYIPEGQIALYPTPDQVYNIVTTAIVQPKEGVTDIPEAPLRKYSTTFEAGALAYLLAMKDTVWSNPAEAARQARIYGSGISNGKAEVQRSYNTGSQRATPRPFGTINSFNRWG